MCINLGRLFNSLPLHQILGPEIGQTGFDGDPVATPLEILHHTFLLETQLACLGNLIRVPT